MIQKTNDPVGEILSRQPLFRGLAEKELRMLAHGTREYRARKQEILFNNGEVPEGIHVVIMGQIKLFIPAQNGWEKVVHVEGPGCTFGEAVVFLDKPYPVSAQAIQDSTVLVVSREVLNRAMDASHQFCRKMLASLSMRLHELLTDIEACTSRTGVQRVICFLTQHAPAGSTSYQVALGVSKQTIASQLNLAPETLSRVLGQLSQQGLITVNGRNITVHDFERLRNYQGTV